MLPALAFPQAFGRFGYAEQLDVPGFTVDRTGFRANQDAAEWLRFATPAERWRPTATSDMEQTVGLGEVDGAPSKVRANLGWPGFSLYFPNGLSFKVASTGAPYVTWRDGSAAENVASPEAAWLILSFRDNQPPIIFGFLGGTASLKVTGKPGDWTIEGPTGFTGWVRVGLPVGLRPVAANTAASLGRLAQEAAKQETTWTSPAPNLMKLSLQADDDAVVATWKFDRPGAVVPLAATLAFLGGYPLQVQTPVERLPYTINGPIDVCTTNEMTIRLPVRRIPAGRGLSVGGDYGGGIGTASPLDLPSVAEIALAVLPATRDSQIRHTADATVAEYLSQAAYFTEPYTDQLLPYDAAGVGIDLAAAHAFLMQALITSANTTSEPNSLVTSVIWRRDWYTWLPWTSDPKRRRRAAALAALASAMSSEPERRLAAGMFQAGLSAERGMEVWKRRTGLTAAEGTLMEPLLGLRAGIFRLRPPITNGEAAFADTLFSPIRVFGDAAVRLLLRDKKWFLEWPALEPKPSLLEFNSAYEVQFDPSLNLSRFRADETFGTTEVAYTPESAGACEVRLTIPSWAKPPPPSVDVPRYSEPMR